MRCPYCQAEVEGPGSFCQNCGAEIKTEESSRRFFDVDPDIIQQPIQTKTSNNYNNSNYSRRTKKNNSSTFILIIIIALCIFGYNYLHKTKEPSNNNGEQKHKYEFLMYVDEIHNDDTDAIVTGQITYGTIKAGDKVKVIDMANVTYDTIVLTIQVNGDVSYEASDGDNVSLFLENASSFDIEKGYAIVKVK